MDDATTHFLDKIRTDLQSKKIAYLRVKVRPGASKNEISGFLDSEEPTLKLCIAAAPEKGKANREVMKFLGKEFQATVEVISGGTTTLKLIKLSR